MEFVLEGHESFCRDGVVTTTANHLERRNEFKIFYATLLPEQILMGSNLMKVILSMCDTWSEIRKDSSKALREMVVASVTASGSDSSSVVSTESDQFPQNVTYELVKTFLTPLSDNLALTMTPSQHSVSQHSASPPNQDTSVLHMPDLSWQATHGNLLGLYAVTPLLSSLSSTRSSYIIESMKTVCLEALTHPQPPVRDIAQSCLHDLGKHAGSLGKRFLRQCLDRLEQLASQDVAEEKELHAAEIDGLLHCVGCIVGSEKGLLLGNFSRVSDMEDSDGVCANSEDDLRVSSVLLKDVHLCMHHQSSTVRQRAAQVVVECCTFGEQHSGPESNSNDGQEVYLTNTVDTVIRVLNSNDEAFVDGTAVTTSAVADHDDEGVWWGVIEGYLLVVESLLLMLVESRVGALRDACHLSSSLPYAGRYTAMLQLVSPLIGHLRQVARHKSFEVRRITSQLIPSLARVVLLCPRFELEKDKIPAEMSFFEEIWDSSCTNINVGECLPFVAFCNELSRGVIFLQLLLYESGQRDNLRDKHDEAWKISEPYFEWIKNPRRRAGEEEKQKRFNFLVSSLMQSVQPLSQGVAQSMPQPLSSGKLDSVSSSSSDIFNSLLTSANQYLSVASLVTVTCETALRGGGGVSVDLLEGAVLEAARQGMLAGPILSSSPLSPWLWDMTSLQLARFLHLDECKNHFSALTALLGTTPPSSLFPAMSLLSAPSFATLCHFIPSISDPAINPILTEVSLSRTETQTETQTQSQTQVIDTCCDSHSHSVRNDNCNLEWIILSQKHDNDALNSLNKLSLEFLCPVIPSLLPSLSASSTMLLTLLLSHWFRCLVTDSHWQLGWGARPSARRMVLEILHVTLRVLSFRVSTRGGSGDNAAACIDIGDGDGFGIGGGDGLTISPSEIPLYAQALASVLSSVSVSFVQSCVQEEKQLGDGASLDVKTGKLILDVCLQAMRVLNVFDAAGAQCSVRCGNDYDSEEAINDVATTGSDEYNSSGGGEDCDAWVACVLRLCAHMADDSGGLNKSLGVLGNVASGVDSSCVVNDDEFSDWDDSDSDIDIDSDSDKDASGLDGDSERIEGLKNVGFNSEAISIDSRVGEIRRLLEEWKA